MKHIVSWSGGKDSTATIILAHEHGLPIDLIVISLLWFDKKRKIYGEYPEHVKWIFEYAIPLFESWGYPVKVITSDHDYLYWFYHVITKSKRPERNGKSSLLERYGYTEIMARAKCEECGLLSPSYKIFKRGGCWFCPNQNIKGFAYLKQTYPELWEELRVLSLEKNMVSNAFRYNLTFPEVEAAVDEYILSLQFAAAQLSLFDLI